jgi:acetolactate synthase I/II/III large subunit
MPSDGHGGLLLTDLLLAYGADVVFGVPGGQTMALYDGILQRAPAIRHVLVRDERSGAYAADAFARMTGRVGVCDATVGPGTAKLPSGLGEALNASVPVLAIVSDLPRPWHVHRYRGAASQALDQAALLAPVTKWVGEVAEPEQLPALVEEAFRAATSGRPGPAALIVPQDVLDAAWHGEEPPPPGSRAEHGRAPTHRPDPAAGELDAAVRVLDAAERPAIVAGGGALASGAGAAVVQLAERVGAAVATTLSGKGAVSETHPLAVGVVGSLGTAAAAEVVGAADVVLLVGTKAGSGATFGWTLPRPDQRIVQVDVDPLELGRAFALAAGLLADARSGVEALVTACTPTERPEWSRTIEAEVGAWRERRRLEADSDARPIAPQRVALALERQLGDEDVLVCDASLSSGWGGAYVEQRTPGRRILSPRGLAGLGWSVPAAIGVAAARTTGRVVVLTGDGGLSYAIGELATLVQHRVPVTVVVLNNSSLGWIRWYRRITFGRGHEEDDFAPTSYAAVAAAFGLESARVEDPAELDAALGQAHEAAGPALVEVVSDTWQTPIASHRRALADATTGALYGG